MGSSLIQIQRDLILDQIKDVTQGDWKVLVIDEESKKIIYNAVKEDDILNNNIANIEQLEEKRDVNEGMDAVYFLTPKAHIVDWLIADLEKKRYQSAFLLWTDRLPTVLRQKIGGSAGSRRIKDEIELSIDYFPRESHLITFRDPWSFPILYNPQCNDLVQKHMKILSDKITGVCVSLGEYPKVRYYKPKEPLHEASVLCYYLSDMIQKSLDSYARAHEEFPPPSSRPQSVLVVTDRSMDLMAPLVHEFTYQAMAHDVLTIKEGEKVTYHMKINEGEANEEEKDAELQETDTVWVENRHRHMKDTIDKLMADFQKFLDKNPNVTGGDDKPTLNSIKDMLAGMPQFQQMKDAYSLHLTMAQDCMNAFQNHKLPELAPVEQTLATGLDEDFRKPKNILQDVVHLLDDEAVTEIDRLRLIMTWLIYRYGVVEEDVNRLVAHAHLSQDRTATIANLKHLGARITAPLKDVKTPPPPIFPIDTKQPLDEEYGLTRFEPNMKHMLDHLCKGTLDQAVFPYLKPDDAATDDMMATSGSLRAAKPNWARGGAGKRAGADNRQRIIVCMAGGATFSESRACYEVSEKLNRDIFLATSHMVSPKMFIRQLQDLSVDKKRLDLPIMRPSPRPPPWVTEPDRPRMPQGMYSAGGPGGPAPPPKSGPMGGPMGGMPSGPGMRRPGGLPAGGLPGRPMAPPTQGMSSMSLQGSTSPRTAAPMPPMGMNGVGTSNHSPTPSSDSNKLEKEKKKKRNIFGIKK